MVEVRGYITTSHYKTILDNSRNEIIGDEPKTSGGTDLGFSPEEFLCSGLATCTCVTLRMYADRKQWDLEKVEVLIEMEREAAQNITNIKRGIQLFGNLTQEQKKRLLEIAEQCPIHKTLTHPINIKTKLV